MKKHIIEDRLPPVPMQSVEPQELSSPSVRLQQAIEQEKARRVSRSRPLDVLEYQAYAQDRVLHLLEGWHLLFFARTGTTHIAEIRSTALQHESERDAQLMQYFKWVQAQYRQHMAQSSQSLAESIASQPVIAEIRYGGISLASSFWLPADIQMGVSLLPATGARLAQGDLTLVEHALPSTSQSLDVLLVTAPPSKTKAELAAQRFINLQVGRRRSWQPST